MIKTERSAAKRDILLALGINAVMLGVFLCFFTPYETNDDFALSNFVNGAMAEKSARMVYINVIVGALLKGLYTLIPAAPWYALLQYVMLFASFTAMTWILLERWERVPALALSIGFISIFGMDAYIVVQYTKTTAAVTVSGVMLMLYALGMENGTKGRRITMAIGIILALLGGMYRYYEFLAAGAVVCWIIIDPLTDAIKCGDGGVKYRLRRAFETVRPFILLLLLFGAVRMIDSAAYRDQEWADYIEYNKARTLVMDHGIPHYDMYEEGYKAIGISENYVSEIRNWNFFDPDKLDTETMWKIAALRGERKLIGGDTAVIDFFPICGPTIIRYWCFAGLVLAGAVWLLFGRHDLKAIISITLSAVICLCMFIYFFLSDRWGIYRVDYGIILALTAVVLWYIPGGKPRKWQASTAMILILAFALQCVYMTKWKDTFSYSSDNTENIKSQSKTIQALVDDGHLMLSDVSILGMPFYIFQPVFGQAIPESADKIVTLGGWHITPDVVRNLSHYGIRNPYKDAVNNPEVYMATENIDLLLSCMREYTPNAEATLVEPLSSQTGLHIYSITAD